MKIKRTPTRKELTREVAELTNVVRNLIEVLKDMRERLEKLENDKTV